MDVFNYQDYKVFLRKALHEKKVQVSASFTYDRMAKACGIQKTYLSRVLNSEEAHLSEEQLYLAATYLGLSNDECEYVQCLRSYQKATNPAYKAATHQKIDEIRATHARSETHLTAKKAVSPSDISSYYLDPNVMLVHIFLAVERFRQNLKDLARQLNLAEDYLSEVLTKLETMKFITLTADGYVLLCESSHLALDSPLYYPYRFMQRVKSLERIQRLSKDNTYNFSVIFSADENARRQIKLKFLEMLQYIEKLANEAPDQEVYQLNFDLFDWSM